MEHSTLYSVAISFGFLAFLSWAWRVLNWVWLRPKKLERLLRQQGFNGNPYRFLHGDSRDIYEMAKEARNKPISLSDDILTRIVPFYYQSIKNFGKNCFAWIGPVPRLYIMEPKLISEVLMKNHIFKKLDPNPVHALVVTGLSNYENEKWAKHRKIVNPAFYLEKLKDMLPTMYLSCSEMVSEWEMLVLKQGSCELDVWPYLQRLSRDVISRTAFGSSYEEGRRIFQLQRQQAELAHHVLQSFYIPGWRFLPSKRIKRMKEIFREVHNCVRSIINNREEVREFEESSDDDLLGMMLKYNQDEIKEHGNNKDAGMSIDDIIEECKLFYFAGQESTANLLVTMILNEVLRLYPPGPVIMRTIDEETKLGDKTLPPGVQLLLPIILIHHDPEIWGDDAKEFKPERFSEGLAKATTNQVSYFPFSWGPRTCIGHNFAMMEAKIVVAMILQRFSFELSPSYTHAPFYIATLKPQNGAHLYYVPTHRNTSPFPDVVEYGV
ncbi:hypothetical protein RJ640_010873 [Escallonia rubra]|uniref:Cytochrome P450 n=1 Tax=Escallonia rubra TaxID=112253 RepID=A0AA88UNA9_9ASTE|nr:hypothetical protein RJ640_010873 [Escallonia rubra]